MYSQFEATTQEKQLADIGRNMMNFSEEYGKIHGLKPVTDNGLRTLNELSHVGGKLTRYGVNFGTTEKNFSEQDRELIANWMQNKVVIERKGAAK
jgi:hypothetical protein